MPPEPHLIEICADRPEDERICPQSPLARNTTRLGDKEDETRTAEAVEAVLLEAAALRDVLADGVHGYMLRHAAVEGGVEVRDRVRAWERLDARLDHRQRAAVVPVVQCSSGKRPDRQASVGNNLE